MDLNLKRKKDTKNHHEMLQSNKNKDFCNTT